MVKRSKFAADKTPVICHIRRLIEVHPALFLVMELSRAGTKRATTLFAELLRRLRAVLSEACLLVNSLVSLDKRRRPNLGEGSRELGLRILGL
jgi:hypothetical protein